MMKLLVILMIIFVTFAVDLYLKMRKQIKLLQQAKEDLLSLLEREREKNNPVDDESVIGTKRTIEEIWNEYESNKSKREIIIDEFGLKKYKILDEDKPGINNTQFTITIDKETWNNS